MYHMGFHLEAQRQQRTIDRKKEVEKSLAQSKVTCVNICYCFMSQLDRYV